MRLRTILLAVGCVLVVGVAATAVILYTTDVNQYRGVLADQVKAATGRELLVGGDLHLEISLNPAIAMHDVSLSNAPWGSRPQMATFRLLEAKVDVLALLSGEIKVDRIVISGGDILLETNKQGEANWDLGGPSSEGPTRLPTLADVVIEDSALTYRDGSTGKSRSLGFKRLSALSDSATSPIKLSFEGAVNDNPVTLSGSVGAAALFLQDSPSRSSWRVQRAALPSASSARSTSLCRARVSTSPSRRTGKAWRISAPRSVWRFPSSAPTTSRSRSAVRTAA